MSRSLLMIVVLLASGCTVHSGSLTDVRANRLVSDEGHRLANLERAARYPWKDEGHCVVREAAGEWATLVEKCYDALDRSRIRFVDEQGVCPVAQAGAVSADDVTRLVGLCLLIQPEIAVGVVLVVGAVVVAAAISAEIEAAHARKQGCRCTCLKEGIGPYTGFLRVASPAVCAERCRNHPDGYTGWECK